jgi:hypothetical protein
MSGYREHSFDPNAYEQPGRPLKPYNWAQWTGVAFCALGILAFFVWGFGRLGLIPQWIDHPAPVIMFGAIGSILINSRREPATQVGSEQLEKNRRVLLITVAVVAAILGAVTVIEFSGAV